jgi:hypothetical protein
VRRLLQHGRKAEEDPVGRFVDQHLLLLFVDGEDARPARHHHVAMFGGVAGLEDALAGRKSSDLNLRG